MTAVAHVLEASPDGDRPVDYAGRHPIAMEELAEIMGFSKHKTEANIPSIAESLSIIGFHVAPWPDSASGRPTG